MSLSSLLGSWKIYMGLGFALGCLVSYGINSVWDVFEEMSHDREIKTITEKLNTQCEAQQQLAQGVSNEYQRKLTNTTNRLNTAIRELRSGTRSTELDSSTIGRDATSGDGRLYYADPAGAIPSLERAAIATKQAEQLIACQRFIEGERQLNQ